MKNMDNKDGSKDWDPNVGWAQNFRKFRWVNALLPALAPMGMVGIFFFGFGTFGLASLILATFLWFDIAKNSKKIWVPISARLIAILATVFGFYMLALQFIPALRG